MTRRLLQYILISLLLASCLGQKETKTTVTRRGGVLINDGSVPVRWSTNAIAAPLNLKISDSFIADFVPADNDVDGHNPIEQVAKEWNNAVGGTTFFNIPANTTPNKNYANATSYNDGELGVYKSTNWFSNVSSTALAIAQFFAVRRNAGSSSEFLELIHADIIVNYKNFNFSSDSNSNTDYDLPSVVLHEMGHFLGLPHETDFGINSVMLPFLSIFDSNRFLFAADEVALRDNYDPNTLTAGQAVSAMKNGFQSENPNEGELVNGYFELRSNGRCFHYINNKKVSEH